MRDAESRLMVLTFLLFFPLMAAAQDAQRVPARITQPVDNESRVILRGNIHPLALPKYDQGAAPESLPMERMLLVLQRSTDQETALRKLLAEQQSKSSANYHKWLTPEEFGQQFGPADADIQAVTDWLASQGFTVDKVAAGRTAIEFSGTAGQVRRSFNTEIHKFTVNDEDHWANAANPQIPAALAPVVKGIFSMNNFPRKPMTKRLGTFTRSKVTGEVKPLYTFTYKNNYYFGVGPADFATIYNVQPLWNAGIDGTGQTIAVVGQSDINPQDVADFRTMFGLSTSGTYLNIIYNGPNPGVLDTNGDEGESDLDVQWAGAVAKGATVDLVVSESTEAAAGVDLSALYIIDNNIAPIMSESYGACEASLGNSGNAFYSSLWEQGAAQGITILIASGDSGSAGCDSPSDTDTAAEYGIAVSGEASTPFNVAVGGTDFYITSDNYTTYWNTTNTSTTQNSAKSYIPEITWNDTCAQVVAGVQSSITCGTSSWTLNSSGYDLVAGSGGPSAVYSKPSWQNVTGVPSSDVRYIPDVSLFAGDGSMGSFYVMCEMDANSSSTSSCDLSSPFASFQGAGGTSASAQVFAGIMALVNQKTGERQGNANYVLYPLAASTGFTGCPSSSGGTTCTFYDITTGNNSVACVGGTSGCSSTNSSTYGYLKSGSTPAYNAGTGYDLATGLGTVNAYNLVNNWASVSGTFIATTTTLTGLPTTTIAHGSSASFNIAVTAASGTPAGDVSLIAQTSCGQSSQYSDTCSVGGYTLTGGAVAGSTNLLPGGTYNVTAHYAGNGTYGASDSAPSQVTVTAEASKTYVALLTFDPSTGVENSSNATSIPYGYPSLLRVDVTNSAGSQCSVSSVPCPTGTVTLSANGQPVPNSGSSSPASYTLNASGYLEDQFILLPLGTYNVVATYAGDNSYTGSSTSETIVVSQAGTATALSAARTSSVVPLTKQDPFNTPRWLVPAFLLGLFLLLVPAKRRRWRAAYGLAALALVAAALVACGGGSSGGGSSSGGTYTLTATVSTASTGAGPTGSVAFYSGSTELGSMTVTGTAGSSSAYASATATLSSTFSGSASVTAKYTGDTNYVSSTSSAVAIQ